MSISGNNIKGTKIRSTAATRLVFEDLDVGTLFTALEESAYRLSGLVDALSQAKIRHIEVVQERDDHAQQLATTVLDAYKLSVDTDGGKYVQAEADRRVRDMLTHDKELYDLESQVIAFKIALEVAQAAFDAEKYLHRSLTGKTNLTTATLNFLSASKTARAAALAHLQEL